MTNRGVFVFSSKVTQYVSNRTIGSLEELMASFSFSLSSVCSYYIQYRYLKKMSFLYRTIAVKLTRNFFYYGKHIIRFIYQPKLLIVFCLSSFQHWMVRVALSLVHNLRKCIIIISQPFISVNSIGMFKGCNHSDLNTKHTIESNENS